MTTDLGLSIPNIEVHLGASAKADGLDKGLVFDDSLGTFRLMNKDLAKIEVLKRKPTNWALWGNRAMVATGVVAVTASLAFTAVHFGRKVMAPVQPAVAEPQTAPAVVAVAPIAQQKEATQPAAAAKTSPAVAPAATIVGPKPEQKPPAPVQQKPVVVPSTQAQTAPTARTSVPAAAPVKPPAIPAQAPVLTKPAPVPSVAKAPIVEAAPKAATQVPGEAVGKSWAVRVEQNGVMFSGHNRLFRVGESLPNGELLVDVDAGSSTYATDKGIRQIRSTTLSR